jgi:hypothetical protein
LLLSVFGEAEETTITESHRSSWNNKEEVDCEKEGLEK